MKVAYSGGLFVAITFAIAHHFVENGFVLFVILKLPKAIPGCWSTSCCAKETKGPMFKLMNSVVQRPA